MPPDFVAKIPDICFIEVKANTSKLRPSQRAFLKLAKGHGFKAAVAHDAMCGPNRREQ
jgi:hypothetical protein